MNRKLSSTKMRDLAQRLVAYEAGAGNPSGPAAARVSEKLRGPLGTVLGVAGFRALIARAITLAKAEVPELSAVQVKADGSLEGSSKVEPQSDKAQIAEGEVILIAQLLGLLVTFIGEALTLSLVQDAYPKATLDDFGFDKGKNLWANKIESRHASRLQK